MAESDRNESLAFAIVVASCILILALPITGLLFAEYSKLHAANAIYQQNAERDRMAASKEISNSCFKSDFAVFSACVNEKVTSYHKQQATNLDLRAQQDMAHWAFWMFVASGLGSLLTGAGIYFVRQNLKEMQAQGRIGRDALKTAHEANAHTLNAIEQQRVNSQKELRAYISVSPDGINPLRKTKAVIGHVLIKNVGQVIAQEITVSLFIELSEGKERTKFAFPKTADRPVGSMHPTAEIRIGTPGRIHEKEMALPIPKGKQGGTEGEYIYVWGRVSYQDGIEDRAYKDRRVTEFCYRYDLESYDVVRGRVRIDKDIARYHGYGNYAT